MNKNLFYDMLYIHHKQHPHLRIGQATYNLMCKIKPERCIEVILTNRDPFYKDDQLESFVNFCLGGRG